MKKAKRLSHFEWLGNLHAARGKDAILHGASFLMAIVLIAAGHGQLATHPLLSAFVLMLFGCGYAIACNIFDESNYLYPALTLWTFSFFLICFAFGVPPLYFPAVATVLIWMLWGAGGVVGVGNRQLNDAIHRCVLLTTIFFGLWANFYHVGDRRVVASVFLLYGLSMALFNRLRPRLSFAYSAAIYLALGAFNGAAITDVLLKQQYGVAVQPIVALVILFGIVEQVSGRFKGAKPYYITALALTLLCLLISMAGCQSLVDELAMIALSVGLPLTALNRQMRGHRNDATPENTYAGIMVCVYRSALVASIPFILMSPLFRIGNAGPMCLFLAAMSAFYIHERDKGPLLGARSIYFHQLAFFGSIGLAWLVAEKDATIMSASWGMAVISILYLLGWAGLRRTGRTKDAGVMADSQATIAGTMVLLSVFGRSWDMAAIVAGVIVCICALIVTLVERRLLTTVAVGVALAFIITALAGMNASPFVVWMIVAILSVAGVLAALICHKRERASITWATFALVLGLSGMTAALGIPDASTAVLCFAASLGVPMAMAAIYFINKKILATILTVLLNVTGVFVLSWHGRMVSPLVLGGAALVMVPFLAGGWFSTRLWSYAGATTAAFAVGILIPAAALFGPSWLLMLTAALLCAVYLCARSVVKDSLSNNAIGAVTHSVAIYVAVIMYSLFGSGVHLAVAIPLLIMSGAYFMASAPASGMRSIAYVFSSMALIPIAAVFCGGNVSQVLSVVALMVPAWAIAAVFKRGAEQENCCRTSLLLGLLFCASGATGILNGAVSIYVVCLFGFLVCLLLRREKLYVQLVLLALAMMGYSWVKGFGTHFSQELYVYLLFIMFLAMAVEMSPFIFRSLDRIVPLPFIRLISWRGVGLGAIIGVLISLICVAGFSLAITEHPSFCKSCHNMGDFFESWQHSSHKEVACVQCHYAPGFAAHVEGKIGALNQVASFVTHRYGEKPHAEVSNAACQRPGCHEDITKNKDTLFKDKVHFNHNLHHDAMVPGRDMPCTTCHSQMEKDEHIGIASSTCFLCHFHGEGKAAKRTYDCQVCHGAPEGEIKIGDMSFDHDAFFVGRKPEQVDCHHCHRTINGGDGSVSPVRCQTCHYGEKLGAIDLSDTKKLHERHVHDEKLGCFECHGILRHGITTKAHKEDVESCQNCHASKGQHSLQAAMYLGTALDDLKGEPNIMYAVGISCIHCHGKEQKLTRGGKEFVTHVSTAKHCVACHGDKDYAEMFNDWQSETKEGLKRVATEIGALTKLISSAPSAGIATESIEAASKRLVRAKALMETVEKDGSLGVHNAFYVSDILDAARSELKQAKAGLEKK